MCLTLGLLIALVVFMASLDLLLFAICRLLLVQTSVSEKGEYPPEVES